MLAIFFATYAAVFIAEIVGDKLLYTTGVLATRYRWGAVVIGMALAFCCKMAAAVAIGAAVATLLEHYRWVVALLTAASFVLLALTMWRKSDVRQPKEKDTRILQGSMVAFATIFFSEWFDVGMQAAGTMAVGVRLVVEATGRRERDGRGRHRLARRGRRDGDQGRARGRVWRERPELDRAAGRAQESALCGRRGHRRDRRAGDARDARAHRRLRWTSATGGRLRHVFSAPPNRYFSRFTKNSTHADARTWLSPFDLIRPDTFISSTRTPR